MAFLLSWSTFPILTGKTKCEERMRCFILVHQTLETKARILVTKTRVTTKMKHLIGWIGFTWDLPLVCKVQLTQIRPLISRASCLFICRVSCRSGFLSVTFGPVKSRSLFVEIPLHSSCFSFISFKSCLSSVEVRSLRSCFAELIPQIFIECKQELSEDHEEGKEGERG